MHTHKSPYNNLQIMQTSLNSQYFSSAILKIWNRISQTNMPHLNIYNLNDQLNKIQLANIKHHNTTSQFTHTCITIHVISSLSNDNYKQRRIIFVTKFWWTKINFFTLLDILTNTLSARIFKHWFFNFLIINTLTKQF